ncbi:MAG: DNA polymerase domain-containing protein [Candidatus Bathyarchaeia archaeon]
MTRGWLLDLHPIGKSSIGLWIKDLRGSVHLHELKWSPKVYIRGSLERLIELAGILSRIYGVNFVERSPRPGAPLETVLEVNVPIGGKRRAAKLILDMGNHGQFQVYNVDLPSMQEFLYEHDLYPTAYVEIRDGEIRALDSVEDLDYDLSWLKMGFLEAELEAGGITPSFKDRLKKIIVKHENEEIALDGPEDRILETLTKLLDELDLDIIITDRGDSFLIPYLHYRAKLNRVRFRLGRLSDPRRIRIRSSSYFSYGRIYHRFKGIKLRGRLHLDSSNSMLYEETGLEGVIEVARITRIPIQDAARRTIGSCMSSLQYYQAYKLGVLLPRIPSKPVYMDGRTLIRADRGGLILDARIGIHWNVAEIDFKSLYPLLMLRYNISGETVNCECCRNNGYEVPDLGFHICKRWRGVVPRTIELPLKKRLSYKLLSREVNDLELKKIYEKRSDALKWILVTSFGYLGFKKAKFGSREAHLAVCALARATLLKAVKIAEKMGFKVIHGIVDSLWVKKEDASEVDYLKLVKKIEGELGLPLSYEGIYKWIAFLPSRANPNKPVNSRYFGVFQDGRLKYRGIEARRRDCPKMVKDMQLRMLKKLAEANSPEELRIKALECLEIYNEYVRKIILGEVNIGDLAVRRVVTKYPDEYLVKSRGAITIKKLEKAGLRVRPGQEVAYIIAGPEPLRTIPLILNPGIYDSSEYIKLLKRASETILSVILKNEK